MSSHQDAVVKHCRNEAYFATPPHDQSCLLPFLLLLVTMAEGDNNDDNRLGSLNPVVVENGENDIVGDEATAVPEQPPPPQVPPGRPSLETSECSDHTTSSFDDDNDDGVLDFASQLRKHRRQVLPSASPSKKKNDFASTLRQHRDRLVRDVWEESHSHTDMTSTNNNNNNNNGDHVVPVVGEVEVAINDNEDNNGTATTDLFLNSGATSDGPHETTSAVAIEDCNNMDLLPDTMSASDGGDGVGDGGTLETFAVQTQGTPTINTIPETAVSSGENTATPDMRLGSSTPDALLDTTLEATDNQLELDDPDKVVVVVKTDDEDDQFFDVGMLEDDFGLLNGGLRSTKDVNDQGPKETSSNDEKSEMTGVFTVEMHQEGKAESDVQKGVDDNGLVGAFDAPPSITIESESSPQDGQEQNGDTEPVVSFDEAPLAKQQEEEEDGRGTYGDDDVADFSAFDEAPVSSPPSPKQPKDATLELGAIDGGDDFHNFGGSEESVSTPNELENAQSEQNEMSNATPDITSTVDVAMNHEDSSFGGDADTTISRSDEGGHLVSNNEDEDDDFGEFESTKVTSADVGEPAETQIVSDDDFGDFGSPGVFATNDATTTPEPEKSLVSQDDNDDDFGDFGSAELSVAKDTTAQEIRASNENDFGDFGSAKPSEAQAESPEDEESSPANNDEDFGDFGSAKISETKEAMPPAPAPAPDGIADDEDDFGDFGSAEFASPKEVEDTPAQKVSTDNGDDDDDDDFGDFGSAKFAGTKEDRIAKQAKDAGVDDGDDDDFGDFGSAEFVVADAKTQPAQADKKESGSSEDDDNFGDFGSATPGAQATATTEEFGNFDDAPTATPTSIVALPPISDVGDKARDFFARMQEKYPFPDHPQNIDDSYGLSSIAGVKVESLLISFQNVPETKEDREHKMLGAVLKDIPTRAGKAGLIIESDGAGPFAPFVYPPGGLRAPEKEMEMERGRRASSMKLARVPDVLPIQLPTGEEMPLDAASPVAGRKKPTLNGQTKVNSDMALPDLGVGTTKAAPGEAGSDKIEKLKKKIPDLSFMLQSALVLPEG